jgi:hypothetical protein
MSAESEEGKTVSLPAIRSWSSNLQKWSKPDSWFLKPDSWSESEWMFFTWIRVLKSRISSGSRIVSRSRIVWRSRIVDDVDWRWVLLSPVQIFGISFDGNVDDDGDQDEEPVEDFADDVDDVLK